MRVNARADASGSRRTSTKAWRRNCAAIVLPKVEIDRTGSTPSQARWTAPATRRSASSPASRRRSASPTPDRCSPTRAWSPPTSAPRTSSPTWAASAPTSNDEVAYARGAVALAARLAGVPLLDQVVTDFRNDERFEREAGEARAMGYAGKLCIHPDQVAIANAAFVPVAGGGRSRPTAAGRLRVGVRRRRRGDRLRGPDGRRTARRPSPPHPRSGRLTARTYWPGPARPPVEDGRTTQHLASLRRPHLS